MRVPRHALCHWHVRRPLDKPVLSVSPTLLTAFNSRLFQPHGIIPSFPVKLGGKIVYVEVEVVDASLDYNILLGRSSTVTSPQNKYFYFLC
jgi:hypothetical protein